MRRSEAGQDRVGTEKATPLGRQVGGLSLVAVLLFAVGCTPPPAPADSSAAPTEAAPTAEFTAIATGASAPTKSGMAAPALESAEVVANDPEIAAKLEPIVKAAMDKHHLRSIMVQVNQDGQPIYRQALGESMSGEPATTDMVLRNGAAVFSYIGFILAKLADEGKISLDDKLSTWMPELPHADEISLKNLVTMTSGYADYVYQKELQDGFYGDPFRQWTPEELIRIGVSAPMQFEPGTNWGYSHTNFVILGRAIEKITGKPLDQVMKEYVIEPMGLTETQAFTTAALPEPFLHVFSSERREALGLKPETPFYEETTFWNPSWTTAEGAIQVSTLKDMLRSFEVIGSGEQLSPEMYHEMTDKKLAGFGHKAEGCAACAQLDDQRSYGMGVVLLGPWIAQSKGFAGNDAVWGYLPSKKLSVAVGTTLAPEAFDAEGGHTAVTMPLFGELTAALAPDEAAPH